MGSFVPDITITSILFEESGMVFQFASDDSIRKDGALQVMQTLFVGHHADYRDELTDLREKAEAVVRDALEDYATADVVDLDDDGGDDDKGMGE